MPTLNALRVEVAVVAVTEARAGAVAVVVAAAGVVVPPMAPQPAPSMSMTKLLSLLSRRQTLQTTRDKYSIVLLFGHCTGYGLVCRS